MALIAWIRDHLVCILIFLVLTLLISAALFGTYRLCSLQRDFRETVEANEAEAMLASSMRKEMSQQVTALRNLVLLRGADAAVQLRKFEKSKTNYDIASVKLSQVFRSSVATSKEELYGLQNADQECKKANFFYEEVVIAVTMRRFDEAARVLVTKISPLQEIWSESLLAIERIQYEQNSEKAQYAERAVENTYGGLVVLLLFSIIATLAMARIFREKWERTSPLLR